MILKSFDLHSRSIQEVYLSLLDLDKFERLGDHWKGQEVSDKAKWTAQKQSTTVVD